MNALLRDQDGVFFLYGYGGTSDKGKIVNYLCQFLYTCFVFSHLFLWFYVCFSVIGLFWKNMDKGA